MGVKYIRSITAARAFRGHETGIHRWKFCRILCRAGLLSGVHVPCRRFLLWIGTCPRFAPLDAVGSAKDIWTAFREGCFGNSPTPFLGYFFLLEDRAKVKTPVANKERYFSVDPEFRGEARKSKLGVDKFQGISYCKRYELLCRRLVLERLYSSACFIMATNDRHTAVTQPADDLTFHRFVAALKGHVVTFMGSKR